MSDLELRTARLVLRPLAERDRADWIATEHVNRAFWAPTMPERPADQSDDQHFDAALARTRDGLVQQNAYRFVARAEGRIIGYCGVGNIVRQAFENGAMGWRVTEAAQGRGLALEMVTVVIDFAFRPGPLPRGLGLHRVECNIMPDNARSLRLAERAGFVREGYGRRMIRIAGAWRDHVMMARLNET